ncbi:probable cytochrome P450 12c1, mitochondrial [Lucilia cuprina]|uniref:probable cytochrome P450 12c1, mitochondrial n=1 Tax=Lucilia cuprina TaxID=7375 RepID=UPI001F06798E|nr:probable cytochrome P450 12c1, mitochondrial [Lucilia cuprina]
MITKMQLKQSKYLFKLINYNKYSTLVDVKINQPALETSYVNSLQAEWSQAKPFKTLPGPTKFQMFRGFMKGGEFHSLAFVDVLKLLRKRYGDIYYMPGLFGLNSNLITFKLEDHEKIFRTEGPYPIRPGNELVNYYRLSRKDNFYVEEYLGVAGNGKQWGKFRHAVNPVLMQPKNAKLYMDPMQKVNNEFVQRIKEIRDPKTLEVPGTFIKDINRLSFESIAVVALDKEMGLIRNTSITPEAKELFENLQIFTRAFYDLGIKPSIYRYIKTPTYKRFAKSMDTMFDICFKYTNEALQRLEKQGGNTEGNSVLEKLLKIDRKIAMIMSIDMLIGGVEVTSSVLSALILCLANNAEKQQKLREEILNTIGKSEKLTIENTKHLPYLRACIKEALRLYPVVFGNLRATGMDLCLSGYQIPKNTNVLLPSNLLLQNESYFPKPSEYIPERWLRVEDMEFSNMSAKNINPFTFLPFGFGPRSCVGKRIVDLEMEITMANLVRNFKIEFNYPSENAFKSYFVNSPVIPLKFKFSDLK